MLARIPLVSVVLLISFAALIAGVLAIVGVPLAGTASAIAAAVVAALLTVPLALAFSHAAPADSGH